MALFILCEKLYIYFYTLCKFRESSGIQFNSKQKFIGIICYLTLFVAVKHTLYYHYYRAFSKTFKDSTKTKSLEAFLHLYLFYVCKIFLTKNNNNKKRLPEFKKVNTVQESRQCLTNCTKSVFLENVFHFDTFI